MNTTTPSINNMTPETGREVKEDGTIINTADIITASLDNTNGGFKTTNLMTEIARGNVIGATSFYGYGQLTTTVALTNHVIWPDGVFNLPPTAGVQISVVSTSAADDGAPVGTGVRTMDIHYLDANLNPLVETITLNGITPVLTVATNIRFIQCMHILSAGSAKAAAGIITATSSAIIYAQIDAGSRRCSSTARMVPIGKKLFVAGATGGSISGTAASGAIIKISSSYFEGHDLSQYGMYIPFGSISSQDMSVAYNFPIPAGPFPAGSVILMEVTVDKAATITGNWYGWLENA
ncbi:MAG: hypothetical protein LUQ28_14170 [Methylococcaceae bacterium]|nr:hypothetical protein [Methylococcaceae bacterium]